MLAKWRLLCTRTNGVACPCIGVVRLIVGVRCIERPLIEVPLYHMTLYVHTRDLFTDVIVKVTMFSVCIIATTLCIVCSGRISGRTDGRTD